MPECLSCKRLAHPGVDDIDVNLWRHWIARHVSPVPFLGWFVIVLRRHAEAMHELTMQECVELGIIQHMLCQAVHDVLGCEKEYVTVFCEVEGYQHVHVHVIAKCHDLPPEFVGSKIFQALKGVTSETTVPVAEIAELCGKVAQAMRR